MRRDAGRGGCPRCRRLHARLHAARLWPGAAEQFKRVKDDGRAEAALIGMYACRMLGTEEPAPLPHALRPALAAEGLRRAV